MRPTLVTGANGHVGSWLCRHLVARGERVRALLRPRAETGALAGLDLERVLGDVLDPASAARAVAGCGRVYHAAAGFHMWAADPEREIVRPSIEGTRHVVEAAARAGVDKVLLVSTAGVVGLSDGPTALRDERGENPHPHTPYLRGKILAEREAFALGARTGLPVTAVNPSYVLGPGFARVSESVRLVHACMTHGTPAWFAGGFGVVDAEDVAVGALLAMEHGAAGARHLLSGENVTVRWFLETVAVLTGLPPPRAPVPVPALRALAFGLELAGRATGTRPPFDRTLVDDFAGRWAWFDTTRARTALGWQARPAREAIARTVAWLRARGFVSAAARR